MTVHIKEFSCGLSLLCELLSSPLILLLLLLLSFDDQLIKILLLTSTSITRSFNDMIIVNEIKSIKQQQQSDVTVVRTLLIE